MLQDFMNRLVKKCVVASAGTHLLLVLLLLVGSAFQARNSSSNDPDPAKAPAAGGPIIEMVTSLESEPSVPAQPQLMLAHKAEPSAPPIASDAPLTRDLAPTRAPRTTRLNLPTVSTNVVSRLGGTRPAFNRPAAVNTGIGQLGQGIDRLFKTLSPGTEISLGSGDNPGEDGASYAQIVKEKYSENWDPLAAGATSEDTVTLVSVTIANDGKVVSARILKPSGDTATDNSVRQALNRVVFIRAFGPETSERQRTYTINFNLRAKSLSE